MTRTTCYLEEQTFVTEVGNIPLDKLCIVVVNKFEFWPFFSFSITSIHLSFSRSFPQPTECRSYQDDAAKCDAVPTEGSE